MQKLPFGVASVFIVTKAIQLAKIILTPRNPFTTNSIYYKVTTIFTGHYLIKKELF